MFPLTTKHMCCALSCVSLISSKVNNLNIAKVQDKIILKILLFHAYELICIINKSIVKLVDLTVNVIVF